MLLQDAAQPPRDVVIAPGMGRLFISSPSPLAAPAAAPTPSAPPDVDAAPRHLRLEAVEVISL